MAVLITGGTGFVGRSLRSAFEDPILVTRNVEAARRTTAAENFDWISWAGGDTEFNPPIDRPIDLVINLMGESIGARRWSAKFKEQLWQSRVAGTRQLIAGLRRNGLNPRCLISASAVGIYGDRGDEMLDETSPPGNDFLARLCVAWEAAAESARELGCRVVIIRLGIVVGQGGALQQMLPLFRWGLGGRLGDGRQWFPWIHLRDLCNMICRAAQDESWHGVFNGVAPGAVTQGEFTAALSRQLGRPAWMPMPAMALRLAVGEFSQALLSSQRARPVAAQRKNFQFAFPDLPSALAEVLA